MQTLKAHIWCQFGFSAYRCAWSSRRWSNCWCCSLYYLLPRTGTLATEKTQYWIACNVTSCWVVWRHIGLRLCNLLLIFLLRCSCCTRCCTCRHSWSSLNKLSSSLCEVRSTMGKFPFHCSKVINAVMLEKYLLFIFVHKHMFLKKCCVQQCCILNMTESGVHRHLLFLLEKLYFSHPFFQTCTTTDEKNLVPTRRKIFRHLHIIVSFVHHTDMESFQLMGDQVFFRFLLTRSHFNSNHWIKI